MTVDLRNDPDFDVTLPPMGQQYQFATDMQPAIQPPPPGIHSDRDIGFVCDNVEPNCEMAAPYMQPSGLGEFLGACEGICQDINTTLGQAGPNTQAQLLPQPTQNLDIQPPAPSPPVYRPETGMRPS